MSGAFIAAEQTFIYETHYTPVLNIVEQYDPNFSNRAIEVQQALWSQAVQLGLPLNRIFFNRFSQMTNISNLSDIELITALYEYKLNSVDSYFRSSTEKVRESIRDRYIREMNDILQRLGGL
ncbi:MAG: hypothetical protein LBE97_02240 [Holosporales bacterium]|jgi:hypothetical protein|nr:hypothetical protein [Holosporales bacterium]